MLDRMSRELQLILSEVVADMELMHNDIVVVDDIDNQVQCIWFN